MAGVNEIHDSSNQKVYCLIGEAVCALYKKSGIQGVVDNLEIGFGFYFCDRGNASSECYTDAELESQGFSRLTSEEFKQLEAAAAELWGE